jgi:carbonic anhydrase
VKVKRLPKVKWLKATPTLKPLTFATSAILTLNSGECDSSCGTATSNENLESKSSAFGLQNAIFKGDLSAEWALCSTGTSQSPIDISSSATTSEGGITFNYQPTSLQSVVNNGHTIQVNYDEGSTIAVGDTTYNLDRFHAPSEHTQDSTPVSMEMHLVHKTADGQLAVIGLMMDTGEANVLLAQVWAEMPAEEGTVSAVGEVDVADVLPSASPYYAYSGSLTTPACSEGVSWFVMNERSSVSQEQVDQFASVIGANARPVQPLNDRTIGQ